MTLHHRYTKARVRGFMKARPSGVETENTKIEAEFDSAPDHTRLPRQY